MRLLHVIRSLDPRAGGPAENVRSIGSCYAGSGVDGEVATLDPPESRWLEGFPLRVHVFGPPMGKYGFNRRILPWLRKNAASYDAVIVNGIWQYHSLATWLALRDSETPYLVFTHGMLDPWFRRRYPLKHLKKLLYWPWAERRVLEDAAAVLFTTQEERRLAKRSFPWYRCHEVVVPYGAAPPSASAADGERQRRLFLQSQPQLFGKRVILFMGRLHAKKGCDLAIAAFARTARDTPDAVLVMAGPDQDGLQTDLASMARRLAIADRVTWTGMLSGDLKWGALRCAEAFILPSHQENFGIAVAEALACGAPVLISNQVNIWREVQADGAGFVAPDDLDGCIDLLRRWLVLDTGERGRMRTAARACFARRFDIAAECAAVVGLVRQLMERRRAS